MRRGKDPAYCTSARSRQSSSGGSGVLEPLVTDDSILELVESLQGDFPDCIAFDDDPFEHLAPMTMQ